MASNQNPRVEIMIRGVIGDIKENILNNLSIYKHRNDPLLSDDVIKRLLNKSVNEIHLVLEPFGYYNSSVETKVVAKNYIWKIRYTISLGKPVKISEIDIKIIGPGEFDNAFVVWKKSFPLKKGSTLLHKPYEDAKTTLIRIAEENGYFKGRLNRHKIQVNPKKNSAVLSLHFETGERHLLGKIFFHQSYFDSKFLERFSPFKTGDPYNIDKLLEFQRLLSYSGYCQRVEVNPRMNDIKNLMVPIDINISPGKRTKYTAGAGYGTDTGFRAKLGIEKNLLNEKGHKASAELEISEIGSDFKTNYDIPLKNPTTDKLSFIFRETKENIPTSKHNTVSTGISRTHQIIGWQHTISLSFEKENFKVGAETGRSNLLIPKILWQKVDADDIINPQKAWSVNFIIQGAAKELFSDSSFIQSRLISKYIISPWDNGRVIARSEIGLTSIADLSNLPVSFRFFAGGDYSIRGYGYQSLGPVDSVGKVVGGKNLIVGSLEYEHTVYSPISIALFYDFGNAFQNWSDISPKKGIGTGVRWNLPFGSLQLDIASSLSYPDQPWRVHIRVGSSL